MWEEMKGWETWVKGEWRGETGGRGEIRWRRKRGGVLKRGQRER